MQPQHCEFSKMVDAWREAEEMGVDTIYTWDHRCRKRLLELMGGKWES